MTRDELKAQIQSKLSQKLNTLFLSDDDDNNDNDEDNDEDDDQDEDLFSTSKKPPLKSSQTTTSTITNTSEASSSETNQTKVPVLSKKPEQPNLKFLTSNTLSASKIDKLNSLSSDSDEDLFCVRKKSSELSSELPSQDTAQSKLNSQKSSSQSRIEQDLLAPIEEKRFKVPAGAESIFDKTSDMNHGVLNRSLNKPNLNQKQGELFDDSTLSLSKSSNFLKNDYLKSKAKLGAARNKKKPSRLNIKKHDPLFNDDQISD